MGRVRLPSIACLVVVFLLSSLVFPAELKAFWDEDTLKTSGIVIGIALGVCLVVVLIAGTMKDLSGDDEEEEEDFLARIVAPKPGGAAGCGYSLLDGKALFRSARPLPPESAMFLPSHPAGPAPAKGSAGEDTGWRRILGSPECHLEKPGVPGYPWGGEDLVPLLRTKGRPCPERVEVPQS